MGDIAELIFEKVRQIDTIGEFTEIFEFGFEAVYAVIHNLLPQILEIEAISRAILELLGNVGSAMVGLKIAAMIGSWLKWAYKAREYRLLGESGQIDKRINYAEDLVDSLNKVGNNPIPASLQNEIVAFFKQETMDAKQFVKYAQKIEAIAERVR